MKNWIYTNGRFFDLVRLPTEKHILVALCKRRSDGVPPSSGIMGVTCLGGW